VAHGKRKGRHKVGWRGAYEGVRLEGVKGGGRGTGPPAPRVSGENGEETGDGGVGGSCKRWGPEGINFAGELE